MKKSILILVVIAMLIAGLFIACGEDESESNTTTDTDKTESETTETDKTETDADEGEMSTSESDKTETTDTSKVSELIGRGATFPRPLYDEMFVRYREETGIQVNYSGVGSSKGISGLMEKIVEFGGTDAFMSDEKLADAQETILHIPTCIGAVSVAYNLEGVKDLKLSGPVLADIFMGKIKSWNDPQIVALNPDKDLPEDAIQVMHRAEGSGTTFVFTDYLSKVSPEWEEKFGRAKEINWAVGLGAKGNDGVTAQIKGQYGSIGYIELSYAIQNNISTALIQNQAGNFIEPSLESASLSAQGEIPADTRVTITNTDHPEGYPISTFTWIIFYQEQNYNNRSKAQAQALVDLLNWVVTDGQQYNEKLNYAKLPEGAVVKAQAIIDKVTYDGEKLDK
jgi:phosphate transport system substrate-binding protein